MTESRNSSIRPEAKKPGVPCKTYFSLLIALVEMAKVSGWRVGDAGGRKRISAGFRFGWRGRAVSSDQQTVISFGRLPTLLPGIGQYGSNGLAWRNLLILLVSPGVLTWSSDSESSFPEEGTSPAVSPAGHSFQAERGPTPAERGLVKYESMG